MLLKEHFEGTEFEKVLVEAILKFFPQHIKDCRENPDLEYHEYGTKRESRLKKILHYFSNIYTVLKDLEITIKFLEKERNLILKHYPHLDSQKTYYKYHFENYFIRVATFNDIIGRLGTLIYQFEINLEKSSSYVFKDKARKEGYEEISLITENLIEKLEEFKKERHNKLHTGLTDIRPLNGIVIWEDLNAIIGSEIVEVLQDYTNQQITTEIKYLIEKSIEVIGIVKEFLEKSTEKLKEIINSNNQ